MSRLRKMGLTIDDPLVPGAAKPTEPPRRNARRPREESGRPELSEGDRASDGRAEAVAACWRSWSGSTRVASYRLPDELLVELAASADELRLQVGLIVTAAITHLLDQPDAVIGELVDRADDARIQGRRATRRTRGRRRTDEQAQVAVGPSTH